MLPSFEGRRSIQFQNKYKPNQSTSIEWKISESKTVQWRMNQPMCHGRKWYTNGLRVFAPWFEKGENITGTTIQCISETKSSSWVSVHKGCSNHHLGSIWITHILVGRYIVHWPHWRRLHSTQMKCYDNDPKVFNALVFRGNGASWVQGNILQHHDEWKPLRYN